MSDNCYFPICFPSDNSAFTFRFLLYLRLFIVMGILWTMEVISFLISPEHPIFYFTDFLNTLHGVFIFILFILKRRVLILIKERFVLFRSFKFIICSSHWNISIFFVESFRWQGMSNKSDKNGSFTVHSIPNTHVLGPINVHPPTNQQFTQ